MGDSYRARRKELHHLAKEVNLLSAEVRALKEKLSARTAGRRARPKKTTAAADFGKGVELSLPECRLGF